MTGRKKLALLTSLLSLCFFQTAILKAAPTYALKNVLKFQTWPELRLSYNKLSNTGDLKTSEGDGLDYASYIYKIPLSIQYRSNATFFVNIISEGPSHYAAPLHDLETFVEGSRLKKNGSSASMGYPFISELWLKLYLTYNHTLQMGQAPYIVGQGYALGGQYSNYGVTYAYEKADQIQWRFRYSILDVENRASMLRSKSNEKYLGRTAESSAYLLATDIKVKTGDITLQPYFGWLHDQTSLENRSASAYFGNFTQQFKAKEDDIYTYGGSASYGSPYADLSFEFAKNGGKTKGQPNQNWDDIKHTGYLIHSEIKGHFGIFTPRAKYILASGNESKVEDLPGAVSGALKRTENAAFTVFSPLNANLVDSYAHSAPVPVVAMAGGYGMNYGIRRPGTYNDPHIWENLTAYNLGFNMIPHEKVFMMVDYWYLKSINPAIGRNAAGTVVALPRDLGSEIDYYATYNICKMLTVGVHGGYFMPGAYYKAIRIDSPTSWNGAASQTVRVDGTADAAYQLELFFVTRF